MICRPKPLGVFVDPFGGLGSGIVWAFTYAGNTLLAIAVPMMGLFGLRRLLVARWLDRSNRTHSNLAIGASSAFAAEPAGDTC
jgi:hypothetical protein